MLKFARRRQQILAHCVGAGSVGTGAAMGLHPRYSRRLVTRHWWVEQLG